MPTPEPNTEPRLLQKIVHNVGCGIAVLWGLGLFVFVFLGYFVARKGPLGWEDGLGRPLTEAPMLMRIFFGQERLWAGWFWFAGDLIAFWGSVALGMAIFGRRAK